MSGNLFAPIMRLTREAAEELFPNPKDADGVVHERTRDLVKANPKGQGAKIRGNTIIVGDAVEIVDGRPLMLEANDGHPGRKHIIEPKRLLPRNKNRYNHKELERERVRASLAKERAK